jgi:HEAT repeat protein
LLGSLDPPDVVSDLADALHDPDGTVRWRAAQALSARQHCWDDDAVIEGLTAAARAAGETNGGVGTMLAETADDRSVTGLLALTRDPEGTTRGTAVRALGDVPAAHVTERLVECTTDPHRQVRADAIRGLSGRRDERLPDLLVDALDDDEQTVRAVAAGALDRYTHRQTVRDRLQTVIEDDSTAHTVRKSAARSHPDYSPGDADPLSSKLFWQGVVALLYPLLGLYVVVAGWRRDGTREAITATIDWFVGLKPLGYLLGHALYWAIGLLLGGGV